MPIPTRTFLLVFDEDGGLSGIYDEEDRDIVEEEVKLEGGKFTTMVADEWVFEYDPSAYPDMGGSFRICPKKYWKMFGDTYPDGGDMTPAYCEELSRFTAGDEVHHFFDGEVEEGKQILEALGVKEVNKGLS